jgi:hypothetical protein
LVLDTTRNKETELCAKEELPWHLDHARIRA